ncbi:MAG: caspase family protein [Anaerolineaceae bacterium]|nr:caspase family protein [Anaerolineaceae bacterium]
MHPIIYQTGVHNDFWIICEPQALIFLKSQLSSIVPVIIIDACYSGIAGKSLNIPIIEAISSMQEQLHNYSASSFAILCSCAENQVSHESFEGGLFSNLLFNIASEGIEAKDKPNLSLFELSPLLSERMLGASADMTPRMYLGPTLPQFPLCKNIQYAPQTYTLSSHLVNVVKALWNDGNRKILTPKEIDRLCGKGAYGNHNKLSLLPWDLVENVPNSTKQRKLTQRGISFMKGKISVPRSITQDPKTGEWYPTEGTEFIFSSNID